MFAQIDEEFIFQFNYILFVMIRLIAFKLLQIKCTALDFRFLTEFKIKKRPANFLFSSCLLFDVVVLRSAKRSLSLSATR